MQSEGCVLASSRNLFKSMRDGGGITFFFFALNSYGWFYLTATEAATDLAAAD
jgi:hypothetical protein